MPSGKPLVTLTRKLPDSVETRMRELFDAQLNADDHPFSQDELKAVVAKCHVLVPTVTDRIDADIIAAHPKVIVRQIDDPVNDGSLGEPAYAPGSKNLDGSPL